MTTNRADAAPALPPIATETPIHVTWIPQRDAAGRGITEPRSLADEAGLDAIAALVRQRIADGAKQGLIEWILHDGRPAPVSGAMRRLFTLRWALRPDGTVGARMTVTLHEVAADFLVRLEDGGFVELPSTPTTTGTTPEKGTDR